jgi:hypothetical protein
MSREAQQEWSIIGARIESIALGTGVLVPGIEGLDRFDNDMTVGASIAKGGDAGSTDVEFLRPWGGIDIDLDVPLLLVDCSIVCEPKEEERKSMMVNVLAGFNR